MFALVICLLSIIILGIKWRREAKINREILVQEQWLNRVLEEEWRQQQEAVRREGEEAEEEERLQMEALVDVEQLEEGEVVGLHEDLDDFSELDSDSENWSESEAEGGLESESEEEEEETCSIILAARKRSARRANVRH